MASLFLAVIYLIFISLGLPDSLLGSGWPSMHLHFQVPSSYAGFVSMTISCMTVLSALLCPRLLRRLHTKWIVVCSIALTVLGLLGFSVSSRYWMLFLFAVPYGLGAGAIDASINQYVAAHYSSSIMNFLHFFYGVGAMISPFIMSQALRLATWNEGYRWTAFLQLGILLICLLSLPLWKSSSAQEEAELRDSAGIREAMHVPGVLPTLAAFFFLSSGESTCFLWTPSYFAGTQPALPPETVASTGSLVFIGMMAGRLLSAFVSNHLGDRRIIRISIAIEVSGLVLVLLPLQGLFHSMAGFILIGAGIGPVYPAIQHMAPANFGRRFSATVISLQMASAYIGSTLMPMVFGHIQQAAGIGIMPLYLMVFAIFNFSLLELAYRKLPS